MSNKIKNQRGVSIYLALVMMVIFLGIGFGLSNILFSLKKTVRGMEDSINALGAADAGVEIILQMDKRCQDEAPFCHNPPCKPDCSGLNSGQSANGTLTNGASYEAQITRNCGLNTIISTGVYNEAKRKIEATIGRFSAGVYLNSATGKSCREFCNQFDCRCTGIGTEKLSDPNWMFWWHSAMAPFSCATTTGNIDNAMILPAQPPQQLTCPTMSMPGSESHPIYWTYCYCSSTNP